MKARMNVAEMQRRVGWARRYEGKSVGEDPDLSGIDPGLHRLAVGKTGFAPAMGDVGDKGNVPGAQAIADEFTEKLAFAHLRGDPRQCRISGRIRATQGERVRPEGQRSLLGALRVAFFGTLDRKSTRLNSSH